MATSLPPVIDNVIGEACIWTVFVQMNAEITSLLSQDLSGQSTEFMERVENFRTVRFVQTERENDGNKR